MKKSLFIFLLFPILAYGKSTNNNEITDTTVIIGIVNEDWWIGKQISSNCQRHLDKLVKNKTKVVVSGVLNCQLNNSFDNKQFYKIISNVAPDSFVNEEYLIEREKINVSIYNYFDQILSLTKEKLELFKNRALIESNKLYKETEIKYKEQFNSAEKVFNNCKSKGLAILDWSIYDESEYTEGTSVRFTVYNPTNKIIKYISFTVIGFNPVGDKVVDIFKRTANITVKGIGPIEPGENAEYSFDYVWHTDIVENANIASIKVQYMDGSIKTIKNPKEIILDKETKDIIFKEE